MAAQPAGCPEMNQCFPVTRDHGSECPPCFCVLFWQISLGWIFFSCYHAHFGEAVPEMKAAAPEDAKSGTHQKKHLQFDTMPAQPRASFQHKHQSSATSSTRGCPHTGFPWLSPLNHPETECGCQQPG